MSKLTAIQKSENFETQFIISSFLNHSCTSIHESLHVRIVFPVRLQIFTMSPFSEMQLQQT